MGEKQRSNSLWGDNPTKIFILLTLLKIKLFLINAWSGSRTHMFVRTAVFETAAYAIPPSRLKSNQGLSFKGT